VSRLDSRQRKKAHTEKLECEKKAFLERVADLEKERAQLHEIIRQDREHQMVQQQQMEHFIGQLQHERDEAIRTKTLETAGLRQKINILKGHVRDLEREQHAMMAQSNSAADFATDFSSFDNLGIDDNTWEDGFTMVGNSEIPVDVAERQQLHGQQTPVPPTSRPAEPKSDSMPFSWNAFYMCLLLGAFIASTSNSSTTSASLPALSDEYRAESAHVLNAVLHSKPDSSHMLFAPSHSGAGQHPQAPALATADMSHMTSPIQQHPPAEPQTHLEHLHSHLTTPSRHQTESAAFSMSAASYSHLTTDPDDTTVYTTDEFGNPIPVMHPEAKPSRLQTAYASMQADRRRTGVDRVLGGQAQERSLLWERVPEKVLRDFKRMVEEVGGQAMEQ